MFVPSTKTKTYINDRFFLNNLVGYGFMGHSEPSLNNSGKAHEISKNGVPVILGDDLGA